jgi:hypothetical protein
MFMAQWLLGVGDLSKRKCSMDVSTTAHVAEAASSLEIFQDEFLVGASTTA